MKLAQQGRQNVGTGQVKIITGTIEVIGHGCQKAGTVLLIIGAALVDTGNLGNGIGIIGWLQW